jgi:hypothetical protein
LLARARHAAIDPTAHHHSPASGSLPHQGFMIGQGNRSSACSKGTSWTATAGPPADPQDRCQKTGPAGRAIATVKVLTGDVLEYKFESREQTRQSVLENVADHRHAVIFVLPGLVRGDPWSRKKNCVPSQRCGPRGGPWGRHVNLTHMQSVRSGWRMGRMHAQPGW